MSCMHRSTRLEQPDHIETTVKLGRKYKELKFCKYLETACKVYDDAGSFINVGYQEPFMALVDDQKIRDCK